jgi:hypothetical protein
MRHTLCVPTNGQGKYIVRVMVAGHKPQVRGKRRRDATRVAMDMQLAREHLTAKRGWVYMALFVQNRARPHSVTIERTTHKQKNHPEGWFFLAA